MGYYRCLLVSGIFHPCNHLLTHGHHTAGFVLDESVFTLGVKTLATLAADYLAMKK